MVSSLFGVQWQKMSLNILKAIYPELYKIRQLSKWVDANSLQVCYNHVVFRHCSARMIIVVLHILTWQSKKSFSRYCVCVCVWEREREWDRGNEKLLSTRQRIYGEICEVRLASVLNVTVFEIDLIRTSRRPKTWVVYFVALLLLPSHPKFLERESFREYYDVRGWKSCV